MATSSRPRFATRTTRQTTGAGGCTPLTEACEFWEWEPAAVRRSCCTHHLLELARFTRDVLARHGIPFWLDDGALLGAVRNGELIPWDVDLDFGILEEHRDAVLALVPEIESAGHVFTPYFDEGVLQIRLSAKNRLHADLILYHEQEGLLVARVDPIFDWPEMRGRTAFPRRFVERFEEVTLEGEPFPAPTPVHEFLRGYRFGDGYMTPRRPRLRPELAPSTNLLKLNGAWDGDSPDEVVGLLERVLIADRDLYRLLGRPSLTHERSTLLWKMSGLPLRPDADRVEGLRASLAVADTSPDVESLVRSLALLEQAIEELEQSTVDVRARRAYRRVVRSREGLAAALARRPHRAGFPFGGPRD